MAACLFREDRGNSFEYVEVCKGGDVKGVSQRLRERSDEESEGLLSLSRKSAFRSSFRVESSLCRRPFWYLTLARPNRS